MITLTVIGILIIIIVVISKIVDNKEVERKQNSIIDQKRSAEDMIYNDVRLSMVDYARRKRKIGKISYDIEEGGHFATEDNPEDLERVYSFICELMENNRFELYSGFNRDIVINKMKREIDKLRNGADGFYGFDD